MATLLDEAALRTELAQLPDWKGDGTAIRRTVTVTDDTKALLLAELEAIAREMNHDPDLDFPDGAVTITMSTHSAGGVTDLDVTYAQRADELIGRLTG
jgi:4a-hydroxytetrahydrobiopterin dehydratase